MKFFRNLPWRMTIGRFGIWLMAVGRFLQVRYANWNSEVRLKTDIDSRNGDYVTIYLSESVTDERFLSFDGPRSQVGKMPPMIQEIFGVKGVVKMSLQRYELQVVKGRVYEWDELLPQIEQIVLKHLTGGGTPKASNTFGHAVGQGG
jgi:hypothetical protein